MSTIAATAPTTRRFRVTPLTVSSGLSWLVVCLAIDELANAGTLVSGLTSLWQTGGSASQLMLRYSWWPRLMVTLLAGGALALAGVLMQQVLRNPLASPSTLGVASGSTLALLIVTLVAPHWLANGAEWVAIAGGLTATALVFVLALPHGLSPVVTVLAGLVVNLYCASFATVLLLLNQDSLNGLMIWGAGSLEQNGWDDALFLWPRLLVGAVLAFLLIKPLRLLDLSDEGARSLGASLLALRLSALTLAVLLTGWIVAAVGLIGFIGLAAPAIVRALGVRTLAQRMLWAMVLGALLLTLTDQLLQRLDGLSPIPIPTGATSALLGAPILLVLLPGLRFATSSLSPTGSLRRVSARRPSLVKLGAMLLAVAVLAALVGRGPDGWAWLSGLENRSLLDWRLPRLGAAAAGGAMLGIAGVLMQRMTGNPMASPELLGISAGTAIGLISAILVIPSVSVSVLYLSGFAGALISGVLIIALNIRTGFVPERVLLSGVALTALLEAVRGVVLAGGDPRGQQVLAWLSGSTYFASATTVSIMLLLTAMMLVLCLCCSRWLSVLPLGPETAQSLGVSLWTSRLVLLGLVAVATVCATLIVGPLSFTGLMAPHMARLLGFTRAREHLISATLIGATLMLMADWLGRQWLYPDEIPAGLVASVIGGLYLMWGIWHSRK